MTDVELEMAFWNEHAHDEQIIWGASWDEGTAHCLAILEPVIRGRQTILDLGCGVGRLAMPVRGWRVDSTVYGVDSSARMLRFAPQVAGIQYVQNDGRILPDLPALNAAYSVVMFQHIPPDAAASYVAQVAQLLMSRGTFCFQTCEDGTGDFLGHASSVGDLTDWCEAAGLEIESITHDNVYGKWLWTTAIKP